MSVTIIKNDKPFSDEDCKTYDAKSKKVAKEWMAQIGFEDIRENERESKGDFRAIWDVAGFHSLLGGEWRIDSEIKKEWGTIWFEEPFRYRSVDFPFRKRDKAQEHATHQMIVGLDLNRLFIVRRAVMLDRDITPITNKWCRNRQASEPFFNVPIDAPQSTFWFKRNGRWKVYRKPQ